MNTIMTPAHMKEWSKEALRQGLTVGFVPTMGFLHEGHLSLMRRARAENDRVVASIFVNPTQFGPGEDFATYPRDPDADSQKCRDCGVDALFMPSATGMYPQGFQTFVDVTTVSQPMCGASRPGHFRGVATVVTKLFNIVMPTNAYFGRKDFQQLRVISRMVEDLDMNLRVVACETVREADGLAMSSRNARLTVAQRPQAVCLHQALLKARELFQAGETRPSAYLSAMTQRVQQEADTVIDYISLVDPDSLEEPAHIEGRVLAALAVRIGNVRLIDNMILE
ncbi:MAG: pantoate--beta-alanine ligase [Thermodesulfobacteriota bacterium]